GPDSPITGDVLEHRSHQRQRSAATSPDTAQTPPGAETQPLLNHTSRTWLMPATRSRALTCGNVYEPPRTRTFGTGPALYRRSRREQRPDLGFYVVAGVGFEPT